MKTYKILFSVGKDRPGIVDDISRILFEREANIEDSRMAVMGGCFSMMTLFSCPLDQVDIIKSDLQDLREMGIETSLHEAQDPTTTHRQASLPLKFEVVAMDHPGIVQKVVHILHTHDVNIQTLNTQVIRAPLSGSPLFDLTLEADVPVDKPIATVKAELSDLAIEMNLDLNFKS
jgi:glycine cleavage system transcriptional repressor